MYIVSDVEGTLTTAVMWMSIARYLELNGMGRHHRWFVRRNYPAVLAYRLGWRDPTLFKAQWVERQARLLRGWSPAQIDALAEWMVAEELWPKRRPEVLDELRRAAAEGLRLVLASGLYQPMVAAFARRLDIPGTISLGTLLTYESGRFTGRFNGPVCNGEEKARRVRIVTGQAPIARAYGDSAADLPMLALSRSPVAVYPDEKLAEAANAGGWRMIT
jgi:phosphoserine phosphatase